jgi:hypothetical protein
VYVPPSRRRYSRRAASATSPEAALQDNRQRRLPFGDSKFRRLAPLVFSQRLISEMIQSYGRDILLQLATPCLPIVFDKPRAERRKFFGCKLLNFSFERLDLVHD